MYCRHCHKFEEQFSIFLLSCYHCYHHCLINIIPHTSPTAIPQVTSLLLLTTEPFYITFRVLSSCCLCVPDWRNPDHVSAYYAWSQHYTSVSPDDFMSFVYFLGRHRGLTNQFDVLLLARYRRYRYRRARTSYFFTANNRKLHDAQHHHGDRDDYNTSSYYHYNRFFYRTTVSNRS